MTVIENDTTMLVRLTAAEIEALRRQLDGRGLTGEQEQLLLAIHTDLGRFDPPAIISCDVCGRPTNERDIEVDRDELQILCPRCAALNRRGRDLLG